MHDDERDTEHRITVGIGDEDSDLSLDLPTAFMTTGQKIGLVLVGLGAVVYLLYRAGLLG